MNTEDKNLNCARVLRKNILILTLIYIEKKLCYKNREREMEDKRCAGGKT